jgi:hypothetical protein
LHQCALHDESGLIDGVKATVCADMARIGAASGVRILERFYRGGGALETLAALGVPRQPTTAQYRSVLLEAGTTHRLPPSPRRCACCATGRM